jgi:Double zinc ribbon
MDRRSANLGAGWRVRVASPIDATLWRLFSSRELRIGCIAMVALECPFCGHANPGGAKFCNACGSHLLLKVCNHCQAVNDQSVKHCYECGAEFLVPSTSPEDAARAACARLQELLRSNPPPLAAANDTAASAAPAEVGVAPEPAAIAESPVPRRAEILRRKARRSARNTALLTAALMSLIAVSAYFVFQHPLEFTELLGASNGRSSAPGALDASATPARSIPGRNGMATRVEQATTTDTPAASGIAHPGSASRTGPSTAAAPPPPPASDHKDAAAPPMAAKRPEAMRAALEAVAPASSAPGLAPTVASPSVKSLPGQIALPADSRASNCTEAIAAAGLCSPSSGDGAQTPGRSRAAAISTSPPRVSTSDKATSRQPSAAQAKGVERQAEANVATKPRDETARAAASQIGTVTSTASRPATAARAPAQSPPASGRENVPRASPIAGPCTEALAAAGLCSPTSTEGSK